MTFIACTVQYYLSAGRLNFDRSISAPVGVDVYRLTKLVGESFGLCDGCGFAGEADRQLVAEKVFNVVFAGVEHAGTVAPKPDSE